MGLAHHLNFRDPDNIALEITASRETYAAAMQLLRDTEMTDDEIRDYAAQLLGPELVGGPPDRLDPCRSTTWSW